MHSYGAIEALKDLDLDIADGETVVLIGPGLRQVRPARIIGGLLLDKTLSPLDA